jgi:hypothetical protein
VRHCSGLKVTAIALFLGMGSAGAAGDVVAVVSSNSQVIALSQSQITDIFLGKSSTFPNGRQATPIDLLEGAPTRDEFYAKVAGKSPAQIKAHWSKIIKRQLSENLNAISYIDDSMVDASVRVIYAP